MWIWWIVSLIILIGCIIFAYRMIVSSYEFLPADKRYFLWFNKETLTQGMPAQRDTIKVLKNKLQSLEDNTTFYEIQFSKFQQRLKALEDLSVLKSPTKESIREEDEEDWKEMYYEENSAKEKIENELDNTLQLLEETEARLKEATEQNIKWTEIKSDYDTRLKDLHSLQNHITLLHRQIAASEEREKELEQLLLSEITVREKYSLMHSEYVALQSEADDLRRRIVELSKNEIDMQVRLVHLNALESKLSICEEEKMRLRNDLLELQKQNEKFLSAFKNS